MAKPILLEEALAEGRVWREGWRQADLKLASKPHYLVTGQAFKLIRAVGFTSYVRGFCDRLTVAELS